MVIPTACVIPNILTKFPSICGYCFNFTLQLPVSQPVFAFVKMWL